MRSHECYMISIHESEIGGGCMWGTLAMAEGHSARKASTGLARAARNA